MHAPTRPVQLALFLLLACTSMAVADVIVTTNGSRLVGQIKSVDDGKLTLETDFAGDLTLAVEKIATIATDKPRHVQMEKQAQVTGTLTAVKNETHLVGDAGKQPHAIQPAAIRAMWKLDEDSPAVRTEKAEQAAAIEARRLKWKVDLEAGVIGSEGNNRRVDANGKVRVEVKNDLFMAGAYLRGAYSQESGKRTDQVLIGGFDGEYYLTERWFAQGMLEFENSPFDDLKLRTTGTAGLGYFLFKEKDLEWKFTGGLGYEHKKYTDGTPTDSHAIANLGMKGRIALTPWLEYQHTTNYFPGLDSLDNFWIGMENAAVIPISADRSWKIKMGVNNKYLKHPASDAKRLDTRYFVNLVWTLE
jgi:putative salt-induced outer membrane protein YdiY